MKSVVKFALLSSAICAFATPAFAQASDDVVVMRRVIAPPNRSQSVPPPIAAQTAQWEASAWTGVPSCSTDAEQYRTVACVRGGATQPDASCTAAKPDTVRTVADYSACGFAWQITGHGAWSSTCSTNATRSTQSKCIRSDGSDAADAQCAPIQRPSDEAGENTAGCSFRWQVGDWGAFDEHCSATATRTRDVACVRTDGAEAADASCVGPKPAASETGADFSRCGFAWQIGDWSDPSSTCSENAEELRAVICRRQDGEIATDANCTDARPEATRQVQSVAGCSFAWTTEPWSSYSSTCSTNATRDREITCLRSDGNAADGPSRCTDAAPATHETADVSSGCSWSWTYSDWTVTPACGSTTRTRTASCLRSDGTAATDDRCDAGQREALTGTVQDLQTCRYSWAPGTWSDWSSTCSTAATRTRAASCVREGATPVADSYCSGTAKPALTETQGVYYGCTYASAYGPPYGSCSSSTSTRATTLTKCTRSDQTDVTAANAGANYPWCAAASSEPCTPTFAPTYGGWSACTPSAQGATTGTQSTSMTACTASDGAAAPLSRCSSSAATKSRSCTIYSYVPAYGTCKPNSTQAIASCSTNAASGESGFVATSLCPASMASRSCTRAIVCDPTPIYRDASSATTRVNTTRAATANLSAAMNTCASIFTAAAKTHAYFMCEWNGQTSEGASSIAVDYADTPIVFNGANLSAPDALYRCNAQ